MPSDYGHYVYLAGFINGPTKIGYSRDPWRRIHQIKPPSDCGVLRLFRTFRVHAAFAVEQEAHRLLEGMAVSGEWFDISPWDARMVVKEAIGNVHVLIGMAPEDVDLYKKYTRLRRQFITRFGVSDPLSASKPTAIKWLGQRADAQRRYQISQDAARRNRARGRGVDDGE